MGTITTITAQCCNDGREVGQRIAAWCRPYDYKTLGRMFGVSPKTAQTWREGSLPQMRHLTAMAAMWGEGFLLDVFAPVLQETDDALDRRLERIEREIQAVRRKAHADAEAAARPTDGHAGRASGLARKAARGTGLILCLMASGLTALAADELRVSSVRTTARPPVVRLTGRREA